MIEFYLKISELATFRTGKPVGWTQSINDLSTWSDWPIHTLVKIRMPIDEVDLIQSNPEDKTSKYLIMRKSPLRGEMVHRHRRKVKKGHNM